MIGKDESPGIALNGLALSKSAWADNDLVLTFLKKIAIVPIGT